MLAAGRLLRAGVAGYGGAARWCSARAGSKEYFDDLVAKNKVVVFMKVSHRPPRGVAWGKGLGG